MSFTLTKSFLEDLSVAITENDGVAVQELLTDLHPVDIATIFDQLSSTKAAYIYFLLPDETGAEILTHLEEDVLEELLAKLTPEEIAEQVDKLETDDAADVIGELPEERQEEVIAHMEDKEHSDEVSDLLTYAEDTAGGLMAKEFIKANINWPVNRCVVSMRKQAEEITRVYSIYVVDDEDKLLGTLSLKSLLFASPQTPVRELYVEGIVSVQADKDDEEVAQIMEKYDLVALPVVDENNVLIGRITIDDVVDVIKEEAEKDFQLASGLSEKVESHDSVLQMSRARLPWLLIGMLGGILGAQVIASYEGQLLIRPELAYFIPLVAAMGGNVGVQSAAIVVQGLANKSIVFRGVLRRLTKETGVGLLNGLICSALIFGYNIVAGNDLDLAWTVSLALMSVIVFAAIFGTLIPLLLDKNKIDPAVATGPFITTLNDVLGLAIYFMIGRMMYGI